MLRLKIAAIAASMLLATAAAIAATTPPHRAAASRVKTAAPTATAVKIDNFTFNPATITVKAGTTVTWTNGDDIPHTVVAKDKSFKSTVLDTGDKFSFTFTRAGQFDYFCSIHPHMTGRVVVIG